MKIDSFILILTITVIGYLITLYIGIARIRKTNLLTKKRKIINIVLLLIIPFIWFPLIRVIIGPSDSLAEISRLRRIDQTKQEYMNSGFDDGTG